METLFFLSIFWQTRLDLSQYFPDTFWLPAASDYLKPFIYLSQVLFLITLVLWLIIYRQRILPTAKSGIHSLTKGKKQPLSLIRQPLIWLVIASVITTITVLLNQPQWWNYYKLISGVGGIVFAIYLYFRLRQGILIKFLTCLTLGVLLQQLIIIIQWFTQSSIGLQWLGEWRTTVHTPGVAKIVIAGQEFLRPHGTFAHSNIAGVLISLMWIPGLIAIRYSLKTKLAAKPLAIILLAWTFTSILAVFLTFSRLAWMGMALQMLFIAFYIYQHVQFPQIKQQLSQHRTTVMLAAISLLIICLTASPLVLSRINSLANQDSLSVDRRVQLNQITLDQIYIQPLQGLGLGNHILQVFQYGPLYGVGIWRQPVHNIYLLSAVELGLPATLAWLTLITISISHLLSPVARRPSLANPPPTSHLLVLVSWLSFAIVGLFDHFWLTIYPASLALWMLLPLTWYLTTKPPKVADVGYRTRTS